jgi:hypothetical protein
MNTDVVGVVVQRLVVIPNKEVNQTMENKVFNITMKLDEDYNPTYIEGLSTDGQAHFIVSQEAPFKVAWVLRYESPAISLDRIMELVEAAAIYYMTAEVMKWS